MRRKQIYHVVRNGQGAWIVQKEGFRRPHLVGETKEEAVLLAKRLARVNEDAEVIVHRADLEVERAFQFHRAAA